MSLATESLPRPAREATPQAAAPQAAAPPGVPVRTLPRWPVTALFAGYVGWWLLGVLDVIIIPLAILMVVLLIRTPGTKVPRGFGVWLLFLLWAGGSIVMVHGGGPMIGFGYRYLIYLSSSVLFVYVYNARSRLTAQYVFGLLTSVWIVTVLGGYLGVVYPSGLIRTPMAYVVQMVKAAIPGTATLLNNELITHMVVRRFSQFNPGSFFELSARPAAPFRFTNNWGNVYSVLLPFAVAYTTRVRGARRYLLWIALPLSAVPALLTLNRGMLLGVGVALIYTAWRMLLMKRPKPLLWLLAGALVGAVLFAVLPVQERIDARLGFEGSSTETRASLYQQSLASVPDSPVFGFGVPQEGDANGPPVGTQGQVWMILVSHGPVALATSLGWLLLALWQSRRRRDLFGLTAHVSLLVGTFELFFYGVLPYGLPLLMVAAALALRPPDEDEEELVADDPVPEPAALRSSAVR